MRLALISILLGLSVPLFFVLKRALRSRRIRQLTAVPFPPEWEGILLRNIALYRRLPSVRVGFKESVRTPFGEPEYGCCLMKNSFGRSRGFYGRRRSRSVLLGDKYERQG